MKVKEIQMDVRKFGYIRVSSKDQNEGRQLEAMKEKEIDERDIFMDKQSGKDFNRVQYQLLKRILRKGDVLFHRRSAAAAAALAIELFLRTRVTSPSAESVERRTGECGQGAPAFLHRAWCNSKARFGEYSQEWKPQRPRNA